jgi:hypothetical protein
VPGKKSHVQRLEKSQQDFKPSEETDAQVSFSCSAAFSGLKI